MLKKLFQDKEISTSLINRFVQLVYGLVLFLLIPLKLSEVDQGIFFTFLSITAAQILFELGFNQAIIQTSANYHGKILSAEDLNVRDLVCNKLILFLKKIKKVFFYISASFFILILTFGFLFFSNIENFYEDYLFIWIMLVLFTSMNIFVIAQISFLKVLEGFPQSIKCVLFRIYLHW